MTFPNYHSTHSHQLHDHPHHVLTRGRIQEHQDFELMPSPLCPSAKSMLTCPPAGEGAPAVLSGSAHMPFLYPPHIDHSNFQAYDTVLVSSSPKAHSSGGIRPDRNHHQQLQKEMEYAAAENAHCGAYYAPSMCGNRVSVDDCNVEDEIINHNGLSNMEEEPQECQTFGVDGDMMKKGRRLGLDQVKALEKAFEVENRLEPERKVRLAVELGLQPRQVAVWFQNRRARWKTKQMERDYNVLKSKFEALKADRDKLMTEKEKLRAEVDRLREHNGVEVATTGRASPENQITDSPGTLASCSGSIEASTLKRGSATLLGHEQLSLVVGGTAADGAAGSNDPCGMHQDNAKRANKSSLQGSSTGIINENGSLSSSDAEHEYVSDDGGAIVDSSTSISKIVTGLIINNPSPRHLQHDAMPHHEFLPRSKAVVSSEDDDDHDHLHLDLCNSNWRLAAAPTSYQINQVAAAPTNHQINQLHKTMIKSEELNHLDEEQDHVNLAYLHHQQGNFSVPFEWYWSTM